MYRPVGWKNPYTGRFNTPHTMQLEQDAYEAGADAMLVALRAMAKNLTDGCGNVNSIYNYVRIPDDIVVRRVTSSPPRAKGKNS